MEMVKNWVLLDVVDNGDGTWTVTGPDSVVKMTSATEFEVTSSAATYINAKTYTISSSSRL
jgi:hypothetical protein